MEGVTGEVVIREDKVSKG